MSKNLFLVGLLLSVILASGYLVQTLTGGEVCVKKCTGEEITFPRCSATRDHCKRRVRKDWRT